MSKMSLYDPFGHFKHKLWPKARPTVKLAFFCVRWRADSLVCKWRATHHWKVLDEGKFFDLDLISIRGLHTKLWAPKVTEVPTLGISRLPHGILGTKWHLGVGPMARHRVYYKGEGGGFPQVQTMMSLVSPWLPVVCSCTKMLQLRINQLVVWFV
jgi:hypothetical protein